VTTLKPGWSPSADSTKATREVDKKKLSNDAKAPTETPKKSISPASSMLSPSKQDSPDSVRKTAKSKQSPATKGARESPYRLDRISPATKGARESPYRFDRISSPGLSQNSASSPRVSTAHAEQVCLGLLD
jgi:hypothetical protein